MIDTFDHANPAFWRDAHGGFYVSFGCLDFPSFSRNVVGDYLRLSPGAIQRNGGHRSDVGHGRSLQPTSDLPCDRSEHRSPLEEVSFHVQSTHVPVTVRSDADGYVTIPVHPGYLIENPWIKHDAGRVINKGYSVTGRLKSGSTKFEHINVNGLMKVGNDHVIILFPEEDADRAEQAFAALGDQYNALNRTTGLTPVEWTVVLIKEKNEASPT